MSQLMPGGAVADRRPSTRALVLCVALFGCLAAAPAPAAIRVVPVGQFSSPTYVDNAPGYPGLLFVVERSGTIQVLDHEEPTGAPFLDISGIVLGDPDLGAGGEEGLLSVAFAPDYDSSGLFYVCFTNLAGNVEVDEFRRSAGSPTLADGSSRRQVLVIRHPNAANHNGGQLQFGPDGHLFLATGDGARRENAPNPERLLGKLLRIDPRLQADGPYGVPADNPYVGAPGRDEVFASGFRNPWRFSFDDDRIAIGDVGQSSFEEVDYLRVPDAAGANFGWPEYEGNELFDPTFPGAPPVTFPIRAYRHANGVCAITGGYVVRDPELPSLYGRYLYADYCAGWVRSLLPRLGPPRAEDDRRAGFARPMISSFGEGAASRIYLAQLSGEVSRLVETVP